MLLLLFLLRFILIRVKVSTSYFEGFVFLVLVKV